MRYTIFRGLTFLRYVIAMHWLSINTGIMMTLLILATLSAHMSCLASFAITSIVSPIVLLAMLILLGGSKNCNPLAIKGDITGGFIGCVVALLLVAV